MLLDVLMNIFGLLIVGVIGGAALLLVYEFMSKNHSFRKVVPIVLATCGAFTGYVITQGLLISYRPSNLFSDFGKGFAPFFVACVIFIVIEYLLSQLIVLLFRHRNKIG